MARAISMRHTIVTPGDRDEFRERAARAKTHYTGVGCRYWLFEEAALPGAFVEFFEADDPDTLQRAHKSAPAPIVESARMYVEVDLT